MVTALVEEPASEVPAAHTHTWLTMNICKHILNIIQHFQGQVSCNDDRIRNEMVVDNQDQELLLESVGDKHLESTTMLGNL